MRLLYAPSSPFARKVRIAICELGLGARIAPVEVDPWRVAALRELNPLSKVPTLERDDGSVLYESGLICEYLNELVGGTLLPASGECRWQVLLTQALCDGLCTAAGRLYADQNRPADQRSPFMMQRFEQTITAALDRLAAQADRLASATPGLGEICVAASLAYLDFRWSGHPWRGGRTVLADWFAAFERRPSMRETGYRTITG